jgi:hypothetical protein
MCPPWKWNVAILGRSANSLQTTLRTLQVSRCIELAQLEDGETLAQPGSPARAGFARVGVEWNRRLLWKEIGLAENAVRSDLLTSRERMAYIFS